MKNPRDIIIKPIITERSMADAEEKKFTFKVDKRANKIEIKNAVENLQDNYTWMVITEPWCGDSAQNLPVIVEIAKLNPNKIRLYILLRDQNSTIIDHYLTNGARAIPKLIVVNETLEKEAFIWGPRPASAQELLNAWKNNPEGKSFEEFEKELHSWYAKDKTQSLQHELIQLLNTLS